MFEKQKLKLASVLYKYAFPVYRWMYFNFKNKKDGYSIKLLNQLIKPGFTILDIGANVGFYSKFLSKQVGPTGKVFCFEPDVTNFKHLQNETINLSNISLHQNAVAAENGTLTLYTSNLLNIDHRTYEPEEYDNKYTVDKIAIDSFIADKFKIDFIKMDIQGFEMEALAGMKQTLITNHDIILFTEFWPYGLQRAGTSAMDMFDFFNRLDFKVYKVEGNKVTPLTANEVSKMKVEFLSDTNIIASRKQLELN